MKKKVKRTEETKKDSSVWVLKEQSCRKMIRNLEKSKVNQEEPKGVLSKSFMGSRQIPSKEITERMEVASI